MIERRVYATVFLPPANSALIWSPAQVEPVLGVERNVKETVVIDRNEQKPFRFSKSLKWFPTRDSKGVSIVVRTERKILLAGDYCLKGEAESCLIERKGSLGELSNNLLGEDYARAMDAFKRFSNSTTHPYLVVECTSTQLRTPSGWVHEPARVVDSLCSLMEGLGLRLILVGKCVDVKQKRTVGDIMLRLMLAHKYKKEVNYSCDTVIAKLSSALEQRETPPKVKDDPA